MSAAPYFKLVRSNPMIKDQHPKMRLLHDPYLYLILGLYLGCSLPVFNQVYDTVKIVVDELFHIPQAQAYCAGQYEVWNPKITTLPGLYVAAKIVNVFVDCNTYYLRMFNLIVSTINIGLFYMLLTFVYGLSCSRLNIALQTINLAVFPPLYFFAHVFYTEPLSLTFLLLFILSALRRWGYVTVFTGLYSIFTRQTNVVWVAMISIQKCLEYVIKASRVYSNRNVSMVRRRTSGVVYELDPKALKKYYDCDDIFNAVFFHLARKFKPLMHNPQMDPEWRSMHPTMLPIFLFGLFVCCNGSIVVGDKDAHAVALNFSQLLYFLLFYGFFGLPLILVRLKSTLQFLRTNRQFVTVAGVASLLIVQFNTVVHPYLLADNRHYSFYVWNRWFGKYVLAPYVLIPAYVFLAASLVDNLIHQNCFSFYAAYFFCLLPGLCLHRLLELRYFIIPYIVARLRFPKLPTWVVVCEFLWYLAINTGFFTVFFTKEVMWGDFTEAQRIIW